MASVHGLLVEALTRRLPVGSRLLGVRTSGFEEVVLSLSPPQADGHRGGLALHLLLLAPVPLFWLEGAREHRMPSEGFEGWVNSRLAGSRLLAADAGASGRVLALRFEGPPAADPRRWSLLLDPLPNACRVLILDSSGIVAQRFPPPAHGFPRGRGKPGEAYKEPDPAYQEPWVSLCEGSCEEDAASGRLWVLLPSLDVAAGQCVLSPLPLPAGAEGTSSGPYEPLEAARRCARCTVAVSRCLRVRNRLTGLLREERRRLSELLERVRQEVAEAEKGKVIRRQAEALLIHAGRLGKGETRVSLPDPLEPKKYLHVDLDPALSGPENAARLFRLASKLERALSKRRRRFEEVESLLAGVDHLLGLTGRLVPRPFGTDSGGEVSCQGAIGLLEYVGRLREESSGLSIQGRAEDLASRVQSALADLRRPLQREGFGARRSAHEVGGRSETDEGAGSIHPRRFVVFGGWTVLVGRNNRENDILTHQVASPRDLWFHARGVSGSHVVLRRSGRSDSPSMEAIEQAASIAAYYSKARASGMVPVIYTEKRYVRKPRRAPAGAAVCIREKVVLVEPRLPAGH